MSGEARITMVIKSGGELNIYVNEAGRDVLIKELEHLSRTSDHTHFGTWDGAEVELCEIPYAPTDTVIHAAKISLRPDDWDEEYFPHVMDGRTKA